MERNVKGRSMRARIIKSNDITTFEIKLEEYLNELKDNDFFEVKFQMGGSRRDVYIALVIDKSGPKEWQL